MTIFWIDDPATVQIEVSEADAKKIYALPSNLTTAVRVKDRKSRKFVLIRREDCGLSCMCALAFKSAARSKE